jgi:hypothetical protein
MLTKRRFCRIFAILSLTVLVPLWAHDLYLMPSVFRTHNGATIVVSLHNGDAFPLSEVAPTPERLQDVRLTGTDSEAAVRDLKIVGNETVGTVLVPASGSLVLSVRTLPNHIDLPPDKFLSYLKEEGLDDVIAWRARHDETAQPGRERYTKFAKSLIQSDKSDSFFGHVVGFPIEIIPLSDPYAVHAGSRLPVRVLFRGKPIAGLQMENAWASHGAHPRMEASLCLSPLLGCGDYIRSK